MDDTPLDEILNGTDPGDESPVTSEPVETETPETIGRERDEHGRFLPKDTGETEATETVTPAATPAAEPEHERVPVRALQDERQKRQQAEDRLRQYDEYFAQLNQQPQEVPDPFTDPEANQAYVIQQAVKAAIEQITPQLQRTQTLSRAEVSEMLARQKYEDYDAKIEVFKEAIASNPFLIEQVQNAPDPATYAYNAAVKYEEAKAYGAAPQPQVQQLQAEINQLKAQLGLDRPKVPSTLADSRSVGSRYAPIDSGDDSLRSILNR